jgi:methylmalonyl-CoA mutase
VRGTVQADILKEDQAQNTCIFSTEFALKLMGDIQQYFIDHEGAQLLLGLDLRLSHRRGRREPDHAARLHARERLHVRRVLPRARDGHRRVRAEPVLLLLQRHRPGVRRDRARRAADLGQGDEAKYGGNERSQKLKYHIQTRPRCTRRRSDFNDIRTTLQALYAIYDNCNSLHTNAYDEAITTPTEEACAGRWRSS